VTASAERDGGYSPQEVSELVSRLGSLSAQVVLVGGQALAFWAHYYRVRAPADLRPYVTLDVDFLGTSAQAAAFADRLPGARLYVPTLDDHTPSSGRVVARNVLGRTLEVDFLHSLAGLSESDVRRNAVEIKDQQGRVLLRVMHPLYCLESRVRNLALLPDKRNRFGVAQAQLAVRVMRQHVMRVLDEPNGVRKALKLIERLADLALSEPGKRCFVDYRVDLLRAIPAQAVPAAEFQQRRWPQIRAQTFAARKALRALFATARGRAAAAGDPKSRRGR
jgi:hypothetical protein